MLYEWMQAAEPPLPPFKNLLKVITIYSDPPEGVSITYWYMFVFNYTPIARASGRSYMLLVAICTCLIFASPLVLFAGRSLLTFNFTIR